MEACRNQLGRFGRRSRAPRAIRRQRRFGYTALSGLWIAADISPLVVRLAMGRFARPRVVVEPLVDKRHCAQIALGKSRGIERVLPAEGYSRGISHRVHEVEVRPALFVGAK